MIAPLPAPSGAGSLLVFSDDWGRHPSSCQHLTGHLLSRYPVTWVNTIGTRAPRLNLATARRVGEKLRQWTQRVEQSARPSDSPADAPHNPLVISPRMWPWFRSRSDRRLNQWLLSRQLGPILQQMPRPITAVTTLPITADLPGQLDADRWVYYCVDDFAQWPGLDGDMLRTMDAVMLQKADAVIAVSPHLQAMIAEQGRQATLLTHGVDLEFWQSPGGTDLPTRERQAAQLFAGLPRPRLVFWGVIDRRMDTATLQQLSADFPSAAIVLIGPCQDPDPLIAGLSGIRILPAQPMCLLPLIAREADVLIMPYADLPVTRAMQPLKLKEYLATGKPVVVNRLPSTAEWRDCLDEASSPQEFSRLVGSHLQCSHRRSAVPVFERLATEQWSAKARVFERILMPASNNPPISQLATQS